ncbi:MAG TPA: MFS transporter [Candidatus Nanopelagicaceae bacterium]|nr:MFS transporter [Candidatus Nanopelagicaceae bacterium]
MAEKTESTFKTPSVLNILSYSSAGFWSMFAWSVFGSYVFFFYEVAVGLSAGYIAFAMIIFTLWDAVNDPLVGFLTDRIFKFTKKIGKRFPWIVIGILPANFVFVLLFMPPTYDTSNPWVLFGWIVFTTCLFDTITTLCFVNVDALFPDKFRTDSARRKARGWGTPLSILALPFASIIPPLIITLKNPVTYIPLAWLCVGILATMAILFLPGMYENKEIKDRYFVSKVERESFVSTLKSSLKQKSFVIYIILFFGFQVVTGSLTGSIPYAVQIVLGGSNPEGDTILLFAFFLQGAIIGAIVWIFLAKKIRNNKKTAVIGGVTLTLAALLTTFYVGLIDSLIYITILGFMMGNFWALMTIYLADVMDERMIITKSDVRGATIGVQAFFSRLSRGVQIATFAIVHTLTGFVEGQTVQTELAKLGVRLHMSVIPAIILAICTFIYWKYYPITPQIWMQNKQKLKELGF